MRKKYEYTGVLIPPQVKAKIREIAQKERRSLGAQALFFIEIGLKEHGIGADQSSAQQGSEA